MPEERMPLSGALRTENYRQRFKKVNLDLIKYALSAIFYRPSGSHTVHCGTVSSVCHTMQGSVCTIRLHHTSQGAIAHSVRNVSMHVVPASHTVLNGRPTSTIAAYLQ